MKIVLQSIFAILISTNFLSAQWSTLTMSQAKASMSSVEINQKLIYAGGTPNNSFSSNVYDVYDFSTGEITAYNYAFNSYDYATAATKDWAIFDRGGSFSGLFYIYDGKSEDWEEVDFNNSRFGYLVEAYNDEAFFIGGATSSNKVIDIYNVKTKSWRQDTIPGVRRDQTPIKIGNRLFLVGGLDGTNAGTSPRTTAVDIYNLETGEWQSTQLSEGRTDIAVAVVGDKLYAAGGFKFNNLSQFGATETMDIIDLKDLSVTTVNLPESNANFRAHAVGTKIVFEGGFSSKGTVYDTESGTWSEETFSIGGENGAVLGDKVYIMSSWQEPGTVFIYDAKADTWLQHILNSPRYESDINVVGNQLLIVGGNDSDRNTSNVVDIFTDTSVVVVTPITVNTEIRNLSCFESSDGEIIVSSVFGGTPPFQFSLNGEPFGNTTVFSNLPAATYTIQVKDAVGTEYKETITLTEPDLIIASGATINPTTGNENGSICIDLVVGGLPPYTFSWSNGGNSLCLENVGPGVYTVSITDSYGCQITESYILEEVVSAYSVNQGIQFEVFPVPANDKVTVKFDRIPQNISLADMNGKILFNQSNNQKLQLELYRKDFAPGVYFLLAEDADGFTNLKRIIFN